MKALELRRPAPVSETPLVPVDRPVPEPGVNQIRIKVHVCGVCHTDLHIVEGDLALPRLPVIPGHQIVGRVEARGPGSDRFATGERVGVAWLNYTCGCCDACLNGRENLCPEARFTGFHVDGGFGQYIVVDEEFAFPIPARFDDAQAAPLMCAGIIGYRALRLSQIKAGGNLGLYGFGASAHLAIQVARHWQCRVFVFTRSQAHRAHALALGAEWAGTADDNPPVQLDASIIFAPAGWVVPLALAHLRPGGTLAINAIHMSPIPEIPYHLIYGERGIRSVTNFTRQDATEFLLLAAEIPIETQVELLELSEANTALQRLKESQFQGAAALCLP